MRCGHSWTLDKKGRRTCRQVRPHFVWRCALAASGPAVRIHRDMSALLRSLGRWFTRMVHSDEAPALARASRSRSQRGMGGRSPSPSKEPTGQGAAAFVRRLFPLVQRRAGRAGCLTAGTTRQEVVERNTADRSCATRADRAARRASSDLTRTTRPRQRANRTRRRRVRGFVAQGKSIQSRLLSGAHANTGAGGGALQRTFCVVVLVGDEPALAEMGKSKKVCTV